MQYVDIAGLDERYMSPEELPVVIGTGTEEGKGALIGVFAGIILKKANGKTAVLLILIAGITLTTAVGYWLCAISGFMPRPLTGSSITTVTAQVSNAIPSFTGATGHMRL